MGTVKQKGNWELALQRIEQAKRDNALTLDLSNLALEDVPESLLELGQLRALNLSINSLSDLPPSLANLTKLRTLELYVNDLTEIPAFVRRLKNLQDLDVGFNQLAEIPEWVRDLTNLKIFDVGNNDITVIPAWLGELTRLEKLELYDNELTKLPQSIGDLKYLATLDAANNKLIALPDVIGRLSNLHTLDLSGNSISAIPETIGDCDKLQILNLSNNRLAAVPATIVGLPRLTDLYLHGNRALDIPEEILGPTYDDVVGKGLKPRVPQEILSYIFSSAEGARALNEAKLILVGQGGVGKSSLVKTLKGEKFREGEKPTEGIKITDWQVPLNRKEVVTLHVWDFGGQEMMHATHQFFLTARSLYLLVLNRRTGGIEREADYWFRLIRAFGGKDAPVIVVLNKQRKEPFDVNRGGWMQKYSSNIKAFAQTDCADAKSMRLLREEIQKQLNQMESLKATFPSRWFDIKNELSQMKTEFVTFDKYREICGRNGENDPQQQTTLAGFLHDLGIALNYKEDPRLRFAYVLKPEWVTQGIYALLHAFVNAKGLFTRYEAERALAPKGYSAEAAEFILGLMEQFELSFSLEDRHNRILIPQLLDDQQPPEAAQFDASNCLNFGYQYLVVPEGLLPRFVVRTHHLSTPSSRWKSGAILYDRESGCRALVRCDTSAEQIRVYVGGPEESRRGLLAIIRHNFNVIHRDYEFQPAELVYPPGAPNKPFSLADLEAFFRDDAAATMPIKISERQIIKPTVASLVEPVTPLTEPLRLFLSYSHKDEKYANELRKTLKLMERNGVIRTWYDRSLSPGERWEARILQEVNEAEIIVCQLSRDFLASDFCTLVELDTAIKRKEAGQAGLAAYVLHDCRWQDVPKLKHFQILPKDAKSIDEWRNKHKYWNEIAEGIQQVVKLVQKQRPVRLQTKDRITGGGAV